MSWTSAKDLKAQLARLWERGELLRDAVTGQARFPLRLPLKAPGSADITDRFVEVRAWVAQLAATDAFRVEWQELRHRVQGTQKLPLCVWIETLADALAWLGKRREWERFSAQVAVTRKTHPALLPWLEKRPLQALERSAVWPQLLDVVTWLVEHPRPGVYLRQVDLPGVHSKFIEAHRGVLAELFDLALPAHAVDRSKAGISQFAARYGFLEKPVRLRFRVLDPALRVVSGSACPDVTLDADSFARLDLAAQRVFITENETNFLAFPPLGNAIVIFGAGYGWDALARSHWLKNCSIHYWGDIDTHGFGILDQLRGHFEHVDSFLMDRATLDAHTLVWGCEDQPLRVDLHRLTPAESALYDDLRDNRIQLGLRLEQEHIGFHWLARRLEQFLDGGARTRPAATVGNASSDLVRRVEAHVKVKFLAESSGHDWHHIDRVRKLALQIAGREDADLAVVELAALLHDIADWKFHGGDDAIGPREAERLLTQERATPDVIAQVVDIVRTISYKGAGVATPMSSLAGRCVQDADRLDAIGAIGIARCFAYGGHAGRPLYDPEVAPVLHASAEEYKAAQGHSLNHFYEKLLLLKERMNTATGKRMAQERHRHMEAFVARFLLEWDASA